MSKGQWTNSERLDSLEKLCQDQDKKITDLERRISTLESGLNWRYVPPPAPWSPYPYYPRQYQVWCDSNSSNKLVNDATWNAVKKW